MEKIIIAPEERKEVEGYFLANDEAFSIAFHDNPEAVTHLVRTILGRNDIIVKSVRTQEDIISTEGHSFTLDMLAVADDGALIDVEMERTRKKGRMLERRMRVYLGALSSRSIEKGNQMYENARDVIVIFITDDDPYGKGRAVYRFTFKDDDGEEMKDAGVVLAVANSRYRDTIESEISSLYRDLFEKEIMKVKNPLLREALRKVKGEGMVEPTTSIIRQRGRAEGIEIGREEGLAEGLAEGREDEKLSIAKKLLIRKMSLDETASITGLAVEKVAEIAAAL